MGCLAASREGGAEDPFHSEGPVCNSMRIGRFDTINEKFSREGLLHSPAQGTTRDWKERPWSPWKCGGGWGSDHQGALEESRIFCSDVREEAFEASGLFQVGDPGLVRCLGPGA